MDDGDWLVLLPVVLSLLVWHSYYEELVASRALGADTLADLGRKGEVIRSGTRSGSVG